MEDDAEPSSPVQTAWRRFCPSPSVYLPKYVNIHNPRLGALNGVLTLLCVVVSLYYFLSNEKFFFTKVPEIYVFICGVRCLPSAAEQDGIVRAARQKDYCQDTRFSYETEGMRYSDITCAGRCGTSTAGSSCMLGQDYVQAGEETAFVPTFYEETYYTSADGASCPPRFSSVQGSPGMCQKTRQHWVAGAEDTRIVFNHEFTVEPHTNSLQYLFPAADLKSHSGSFNSQGYDKGMVTILFGHEGQERARFEQSFPTNLSLQELLDAASYSDIDSGANLTLDARYLRPELGVSPDWADGRGPPIRLTGASLHVDVYITDRGTCPMYDIFREKVKMIEVESGRPVTCLMVFAERRWVTKDANHLIGGAEQAMRVRHVSGIQIQFRKMGKFSFLDEQQITAGVTVFFVWIQLPLSMTYWFIVLFLGVLSDIYSRVMHQELNLKEACKGLVARLMCHSAAFMDLADHEDGISKARIRDRFRDYIADNEDIDDEELERFVEFVFDGLKTSGYHPRSSPDYVSVQEFCEVCASNEPLNFQALVRLFDNDRKPGVLEALFLDNSLRDLQATSEEPIDLTLYEGGAGHSRVQEAVQEVQEMMSNLKNIEMSALRAARKLEIGEEVEGLVGAEAAHKPRRAPAKLNQRESVASIADEEDEVFGGEEQEQVF